MAIESPIKKDVAAATKIMDALQRLYNVYFQGGEDEPPRAQRKELDTLIAKLKTAQATATNAGDRFSITSLVNRYQSMSNRWDKHLRGIENGTIPIPKRRD